MSDRLGEILKGSKHRLSSFRDKEVHWLKERIKDKSGKFFVECLSRKKDLQLKPEEVVRQLLLPRLTIGYGYTLDWIRVEHPIRFGRVNSKRADIGISGKADATGEFIFVEVRNQNAKDCNGQLKSYCHATGAPIPVWSNGNEISYYNRKDPNHFLDLMDIPTADLKLEEFLEDKFTWKNLVYLDKVLVENKSIKDLITEMDDEVLANAGVDVFEEVFKLSLTKLFDEASSRANKQSLDGYPNR